MSKSIQRDSYTICINRSNSDHAHWPETLSLSLAPAGLLRAAEGRGVVQVDEFVFCIPDAQASEYR